MIVVNEMFGPTIQGEGPYTGHSVWFLRLAGCNLHCKWCDTAYTWRFSDTHPHENDRVYNRKEESHQRKSKDILDAMLDVNWRHWVISGGEPLLQDVALTNLLWSYSYQRKSRVFFEVETAGTIRPTPKMQQLKIHFNVSPKLAHSGNERKAAYKPKVLKWFAQRPRVAFKFVVGSVDDLEEVEMIVSDIGIRDEIVWLMPLGTKKVQIYDNSKWLVEETMKRGWNFSTRLHTLLWGNKRGV